MLSGAIHFRGRKVCGRAEAAECKGGAGPHSAPGSREEAWQFLPPALSHFSVPEGPSLLMHGSHAHPTAGQRIRKLSFFSHKLGTW